jgi:hypothetical protein
VSEFTQAQIDTLKAAIASGTLHVAFADRSQTFHSLEDMLKLLAYMERTTNGTDTSYYRLAATSKGL